jgi:glycosyltransferase involved in cell wall biosynthesis
MNMRLITTRDIPKTLDNPMVKAVSTIFDETYYIRGVVNKVLTKALGVSRSGTEQIADHWLKRHGKGQEVVVMPAVFPETAQAARKATAIELLAELSGYARQALHEYAYYGMSMPYFIRMESQMKTLSKVEKIIALSEYAKKTFEQAGYENVINTGYGIDCENFKPPENPPERFQSIFVGAVKPMKGIRYVVEAWKAKPFEFKIVGPVPRQIRRTIPSGIEITGYCDPCSHYQQASCLLFPSLSESFGKTILEAMACGIPVIATRNCGGADVINKRNGIVIEAMNPKAISDAIQYLKDNPKEAGRMGKSARKTAMEMSVEKLTGRLKKALQK